jgi:xanthine dehydrogenase YagS FAD-binding subunit
VVWTDPAGVVTRARVYLGAVASFPTPASATAEALLGRPLGAETIAEAAALARRDATPLDNTDFLPAWRGLMVARYVEAALRECAGLPQERMPPSHGLDPL